MSDSFDEQKTTFENVLQEMKLLKQENIMVKQRLQLLETKLDEYEQKEKANNIVVVGIPPQSDTSPTNIITKITTAMQVPINEGDIQECFRLNKKEDGPILVKLTNYNKKKEILSKVRQLKGITVKKCNLQGNERKIYLNEDLS